MATLTIQDLIDKKAELDGKKKRKYEIETSLGTMIFKPPTATILSESADMSGNDGDAYLIYNTVLEPNLSDSKLQKEYGCIEPFDIVGKIFSPGEVRQIANALVEIAGYGKNKLAVKVLDQVKN